MAHSAAVRAVEVGPHDRESYFRAAYDLLAEHGSAGVTVAALCDRVGVTKGSFYHHFIDLPDFVEALATRWQAWVEHIIDTCLAEPDLLRRYELAANNHVVLVTGAEPAIYAWARTEPAIAGAVHVVLTRGYELGEKLYGPVTGDPRVATSLTRMMIAALQGMQQRSYRIHRIASSRSSPNGAVGACTSTWRSRAWVTGQWSVLVAGCRSRSPRTGRSCSPKAAGGCSTPPSPRRSRR